MSLVLLDNFTTNLANFRRWNCYPGARVDSPVPIYQLNIPEVYKTWTFTSNYPDWRELQAYFDHVDKVCNLSKDTAFETVVTNCEFDQNTVKWTVKTADGRKTKTRFLIIAAGFAAKRYVPPYTTLHSGLRRMLMSKGSMLLSLEQELRGSKSPRNGVPRSIT
jgi:cation diffusion facilitator CzcD-associated flavoprotein CzcO